MQIKEQPMLSDHLDTCGVKEGDIIQLDPLMGRSSEFCLKRTKIDLISSDLEEKINSSFFKVLGSQKGESFHIQLAVAETRGRNKVKRKRYVAKVLKGNPIKLNGCYVLECFLEENDCIEIGFNFLKMKRDTPRENFDLQQQLIANNKKIIKSKLPLLITGETGVGKTSLAKKIHEESNRRGRFVHLNISSFSPNLLESELFGHVKGAFTGAMNEKRGAFREATEGTLFIDEVDSLPMEIQTKLLIFLDSYKARPVGGGSEYEVDLRVIFASGSELKHLVQMGKMRKDFFFRISSGHGFNLNSLRDDQTLVENFCSWYMLENGISISKKLLEFYQTLPWPGNYRQLKGHLERKKVLSNSWKLDFDDIDEQLIEQSSELIAIKEIENISTLKEVKLAYIKKVFYQFGKNYTQAAAKLSISSRSLRNIVSENSL